MTKCKAVRPDLAKWSWHSKKSMSILWLLFFHSNVVFMFVTSGNKKCGMFCWKRIKPKPTLGLPDLFPRRCLPNTECMAHLIPGRYMDSRSEMWSELCFQWLTGWSWSPEEEMLALPSLGRKFIGGRKLKRPWWKAWGRPALKQTGQFLVFLYGVFQSS